MKHFSIVILMLAAGISSIFAQQRPVNMTFSGIVERSQIDLQPGTVTDASELAGSSSLGAFTFRGHHNDPGVPQSSSTCSGATKVYFPILAGGGVFRFQGGSLMTVKVADGSLCIDFSVLLAQFTVTYQVTGGTGRFKNASGTLVMKATWSPALYDSSNNAVLLTTSGSFEGNILGLPAGEEAQGERQ